jgi:hypothetical protein
MNPATKPPVLTSKLIRPARIEMRFSNRTQYYLVVDMYYQELSLPNRPTSEGSVARSYSFPVGRKGGLRKQDMELYLVLQENDSPELQNRTIVYWEVAGRNLGDVHQDLLNVPGFKEILPPAKLKSDQAGAPEISLLSDGSGKLLGLTINPLFPRFVEADKQGRQVVKYLLPLAGLVVGLLLGPVLRPRRR